MARITPISMAAPRCAGQRLEKVFIAAGFEFDRQSGSHRCYVKPGISRPIIIPTYKEIPVSIITNNLKTAGISRDEYFQLLEEV